MEEIIKCKCPKGYYHDNRVSCQSYKQMQKEQRVSLETLRHFNIISQHDWKYQPEKGKYIFENNNALPWELRIKYQSEPEYGMSMSPLLALVIIVIFILTIIL